MNAAVQIASAAESDLRGIYEYIACKLNSLPSARRILRGLMSAISGIAENPERWSPYPHEPWFSRGVRMRIIGSYVIFFTFDEVANVAKVIRVLYCRRDFNSGVSDYFNPKNGS